MWGADPGGRGRKGREGPASQSLLPVAASSPGLVTLLPPEEAIVPRCLRGILSANPENQPSTPCCWMGTQTALHEGWSEPPLLERGLLTLRAQWPISGLKPPPRPPTSPGSSMEWGGGLGRGSLLLSALLNCELARARGELMHPGVGPGPGSAPPTQSETLSPDPFDKGGVAPLSGGAEVRFPHSP